MDAFGLSIFDPILDEAEERRGRGPWGDSAQHCWAACRFGLMDPMGMAGHLAAFAGDFGELFAWIPGDSQRDILAQHWGATCASLVRIPIFPSKICDCCCLSR